MDPSNYQPPYPANHPLDFWRRQVVADVQAMLGTGGTYWRPGEDPVTLTGIWHAPYSNERLDGLGIPGIETAMPALIFRTADLPSPAPAHGDTWSDGVTTWYVIEVRPSTPGMTVLIRIPG
jgi:hypothetical protein